MDIQWDGEASLMRVTPFATTEPGEELVARGTLYELVGQVLELAPDRQRDLLLRAAGPGGTTDYDVDAIRELAARPEFTGAPGDEEANAAEIELAEDPAAPIGEDVSGPDRDDARGQDGEK